MGHRSDQGPRVRSGRRAPVKALIGAFIRRYGWPAHGAERPLSIGHRGACAHAHENTLASFHVAARLGADMWELDARLSRDGAVIVSHDEVVTGADGRQVVLAEHDAADIARIRLRRGGHVPLLQDVINLAIETSCGLYVEVKERAAAPPAMALLAKSAVPFAALGSFDHETVRALVAARPAEPRFPISVLVRNGEDPFAAAADTGAEIIHLCWERASDEPDRLITPDLLARAARENLIVVIWHEERRAVLERLMAMPVAGICTDKPEMMNRYRPHPEFPIDIVCHRGMNAVAPENTLHAARLCFDQGFQVVELDVRRTADGALAVIHDAVLDRTTDGSGPVAARTMAELGRLSAGAWFDPFFAGERVTPLAAFLEAAGADGRLYVEVKDTDPAATVAEVKRAGLLSRVFFWSPDPSRLAELRRLSDDMQIMVERESFSSVHEAIQILRPTIVQFEAEMSVPSEIEACRRAGVAPMVKYFGSDEGVFERIIRLKPALINLNRPDIFLAAYASVIGRRSHRAAFLGRTSII
ncbi:glycerophosphoryl diester phosphodiesterase [Rhizobiales bacterium GAS191]|nr:glycerophosphoryl diester phosphodiesterase [Rhizobiales bacterium GAS113]SEE50214.1 glycerophosphoryl diester phosphodiesterase [Rhizobiales bacterium GAS191]